MVRTRSTNGEEDKCMQCFSGENLKERDHLETGLPKVVYGPGKKKKMSEYPARGNVMKHSRERRKQDGRWPQMPSARQITTSLPGSVSSSVFR